MIQSGQRNVKPACFARRPEKASSEKGPAAKLRAVDQLAAYLDDVVNRNFRVGLV